MTSTVKTSLMVILVGAVVGVSCLPSRACSVPVFRYALERWEADLYKFILFHRGDLSAEQQAHVDRLHTEGPGRDANMSMRSFDLDGESSAGPAEEMRALWESQQVSELPWLVVRSPATQMQFWSGKLMSAAAETIFDSPVRREIAKRLLFGQTAVWVLLESAKTGKEDPGGQDQTQNEVAFALLKQRLAKEQAELKLPEIEEVDIQNGLVDIDPEELKIEFTVMRLSREDPRERPFVEMLLATEEDLHDFQQPMAFPIFGRGRVLYALVGKGISDENIHAACVELTGPCTCQVKAQNLGADLLMSVDWARLVKPTADVEKPLPPLTGLAGLGEPFKDASQGESGRSDVVPEATLDSAVVTRQVSVSDPQVDEQTAVLGRESGVGKDPLPQALGPGAQETPFSPLWIGMSILLGLGVLGIAGASLLIVRR